MQAQQGYVASDSDSDDDSDEDYATPGSYKKSKSGKTPKGYKGKTPGGNGAHGQNININR